ncbi:hypothetical protein IAU59_004485 [Kwoniella sp. CBS 9459]
MMYTPTPAARRPRPPRSLSRQRTPLISPSESTNEKTEHSYLSAEDTSQGPRPSASKTSSSETPLSTYLRRRTENARSNLARISASPADVSFALDPQPPSSSSSSIIIPGTDPSEMSVGLSGKQSGPIGLGLSESVKLPSSGSNEVVAETSPPPPYGHMTLSSLEQPQADSPSTLATANRSHNPLRQNSGVPSRTPSPSPSLRVQEMASQVPQNRATLDARPPAKGRSGLSSSEEELSDREVRRRLKELKQQLQRREDELIIAAKVADKALRSHEQVVAILPHQMKARMPAHLVNLPSDILDPTASPQHFRSLSGSGSPYTVHLRQFSSSSNTQTLSPIESYPPTASTYQVEQFQTISPQFPEYGLDSPFRIISPEHRMRDPHPSFPSVRLSGTSVAMPHHRQRSRPSIFGSHSFVSTRAPSPKYARMSALQAEAEDRIIALEQALMEARENEEGQRKLASRLRKDMEKMQRELLRADEQRAQEDLKLLKASINGGIGARKRDSSAEEGMTVDDTRSRKSSEESRKSQDDKQKLGWGSTAFPEFPSAGPSRSASHGRRPQTSTTIARGGPLSEEPLGQITTAALRDEVNDADDSDSSLEARPTTTLLSVPTVPVAEIDTMSSTSQEDERFKTRSPSRKLKQKSPNSSAKGQPRTKPSTDTRFLSPPKPSKSQSGGHGHGVNPPTPRVTIESPSMSFGTDGPSRQRKREGSSSHESATSIRRSPWPARRAPEADLSPDIRRTLDFFSSDPQAPAPSHSHSRSPSMSPALASVSSRMASMRAYLSHNLSVGPVGMGRTLGSELGSEFGEDWEKDIRSLDDTRLDLVDQGPASPSPPSRSTRSSLLPRRFLAHHDPEADQEDDDTSLFSPMSQPPFPLPANVSAALSSLAMALAPDNMFNQSFDTTLPIVPRGSLREPGLDYTAYEMLSEACKARQIKWADDRSADGAQAEAERGSEAADTVEVSRPGRAFMPSQESIRQWGKNKDPWEGVEYSSDELAVSDESTSQKGRPEGFNPRPALSIISAGKRPVSYIDHVSGDTPRKYALAHRRANSAAIIARSEPSQGPSRSDGQADTRDNEGRATEYRVPAQNFRPDRTLTRRGLRTLQTSLASSATATTSATTSASTTVQAMAKLTSASASSPTSNVSSHSSRRENKTVRFATHISSSDIPSTIPARLVHDVFCWMGIFLEYFEWALILVIRICIDIRSGPGGSAGLRRRRRAKRYYL